MDIMRMLLGDTFCLDQIGHIATTILSIAGVVTLLVKPVRKKFIEAITQDNAARAGLCALLRTKIISECNKAKANNGMYFYDRENMIDMFEQYTRLGGNHAIRELVEETLKLPTLMR